VPDAEEGSGAFYVQFDKKKKVKRKKKGSAAAKAGTPKGVAYEKKPQFQRSNSDSR
jgi:hypothetical protein